MSPFQKPSETVQGLQRRYAEIIQGTANSYFNIGSKKASQNMIELSDVAQQYNNIGGGRNMQQHRTQLDTNINERSLAEGFSLPRKSSKSPRSNEKEEILKSVYTGHMKKIGLSRMAKSSKAGLMPSIRE